MSIEYYECLGTDLPLQYHSAKRGVNSEMRGDYSALVQRHLYVIILFHHRSYTIFIMSEGVWDPPNPDLFIFVPVSRILLSAFRSVHAVTAVEEKHLRPPPQVCASCSSITLKVLKLWGSIQSVQILHWFAFQSSWSSLWIPGYPNKNQTFNPSSSFNNGFPYH